MKVNKKFFGRIRYVFVKYCFIFKICLFFRLFFYEYDFRKKNYFVEDFFFFLKFIGIEFKLM